MSVPSAPQHGSSESWTTDGRRRTSCERDGGGRGSSQRRCFPASCSDGRTASSSDRVANKDMQQKKQSTNIPKQIYFLAIFKHSRRKSKNILLSHKHTKIMYRQGNIKQFVSILIGHCCHETFYPLLPQGQC